MTATGKEDFGNFLNRLKVCEIVGPVNEKLNNWPLRRLSLKSSLGKTFGSILRRNRIEPFPLNDSCTDLILHDLEINLDLFKKILEEDSSIACQLLNKAFEIVGVSHEIVPAADVLLVEWIVKCFESIPATKFFIIPIDAIAILVNNLLYAKTEYHSQLAVCLLRNCLCFGVLLNQYLSDFRVGPKKHSKYTVIKYLSEIDTGVGDFVVNLLHDWTQPHSPDFLHALDCICYVIVHISIPDERFDVIIASVMEYLQLFVSLHLARLYFPLLLKHPRTRLLVEPLLSYLATHNKSTVCKKFIEIIGAQVAADHQLLTFEHLRLVETLFHMAQRNTKKISSLALRALVQIYKQYSPVSESVPPASQAVSDIPRLIMTLFTDCRNRVENHMVLLFGESDNGTQEDKRIARARNLVQIYTTLFNADNDVALRHFYHMMMGFAEAAKLTCILVKELPNGNADRCKELEESIANLFEYPVTALNDLRYLRSRQCDLRDVNDLNDDDFKDAVIRFLSNQIVFLIQRFNYHPIIATFETLINKIWVFNEVMNQQVIMHINCFMKSKVTGCSSDLYIHWAFDTDVREIANLLGVLFEVVPEAFEEGDARFLRQILAN